MTANSSTFLPHLIFIFKGMQVTLTFTVCSLIGGLPLGILLALSKLSKVSLVSRLGQLYTSLFRGTPLLVQLGLIYFALPQLIGYSISPFEAGILTFSLNSAAYSSEIIRAGIQAIDRGQWEAGQLLGLSYGQILRGVILPQAIRNSLPALINELIDLLKESALVSTIGEADLLRRAQIIAAENYTYFEPLLIAAGGYYSLVMAIGYLAKYLERKLHYA